MFKSCGREKGGRNEIRICVENCLHFIVEVFDTTKP